MRGGFSLGKKRLAASLRPVACPWENDTKKSRLTQNQLREIAFRVLDITCFTPRKAKVCNVFELFSRFFLDVFSKVLKAIETDWQTDKREPDLSCVMPVINLAFSLTFFAVFLANMPSLIYSLKGMGKLKLKIWVLLFTCAAIFFCYGFCFQNCTFAAEKSDASKKSTDRREPIHKGKRANIKRDSSLPSGPVNMEQAVRKALERNPSLASQEARTFSSEENRKSKRGAFGPKLGMNYSAVKQEHKNSPATSRSPEYGTFAWTVEISQPVFQGFRLLADYQKAALQAESDKAALRDAELAMTEETQTEFLLCLQAVENVRSESESLGRLRDQLRITRAFYEVGLRPRLDVLQAEVDVSQSENLLIQAENIRDTAYARLNTLLGYPAAAQINYQGKLAHIPFKLTFEECLNTAYQKRPDLFMAEKAVAMAQKDQKLAQSGYYPQIDAYYSITQRGNTPDLQKSGNNGSRQHSWEVGATARWDVFQWGTTFYDDKRAAWLVSAMRHEEDSLRLNVGYEVKARFLAVKEAEKRIAVAEKEIISAREAYQAAIARYQEQVGTNFDVLDASSNLTRAEASLTSARADYLTALAQLYRSMGEFHPDLLNS